MEPIFPLHEERINMFCGMPVCIITKEGTRHIGILSHCRGGLVTLNADQIGPAISSEKPTSEEKKAKGKNAKKGKKAETKAAVAPPAKAEIQAYPFDPLDPFYRYPEPGPYTYRPYNPFGEAFAIDLSLIAFLFLLL
ncbi:hypothetical protein ACFFSY_02910 [Paenibacillus aurantiacus]|uniref:Uncharacterized protein n=1 Tax=Paenibacillus aurantiacus TaxID=1936118 RepID=A0ABV5KL80_9BACL